ncbi:YoaK family protein [Allosphingosinicella vermicomposti]|uniref:YoaK family protein n=1 Tax=Allosphingosinicella vermicomposti TaxID=614671 RepID=UPI000D0E4616|nr:YoaK family protein [Allosphingosinicella vermicomposti]
MDRYDRNARLLAISLSALAGYVDAVGFIELDGYFVSFMSGNSTRLAVGIAERASEAALAGALIFTFLLGVIGGSLAGHLAGPRRRPVVLMLIAALLSTAGAAGMADLAVVAIPAMAFAMGAENATFARNGEVTVGLTYMTGALVKIGQRLTVALLGGPRFSWLSYAFLWTGLICGAVLGSIAYGRFGLGALWAPALLALFLAFFTRNEPGDEGSGCA